jgi:hypothetical protein
MTTASAISAELAGGSWTRGVPTNGPGSDYCAQIPSIAGVVLQFIQPLREWFDALAGDPVATASVAATWEDASRLLIGIPDIVQQARPSLDELDGRTVRALRGRHEDLQRIALDASEWTSAAAAALRLASRIVDATRSYVCDALIQLAKFADELFSFAVNPFVISERVEDFARGAYDLIDATGRLVTDLVEALFALDSLLQRLLPIVDEGLGELRRIVAHILPMANALITAPFGPVGVGVGLVLGGAAQNFLQDSTDVEELDPHALHGDERLAWDESQKVTHLSSLSDLVSVNGTTDAMGTADATVIDVKRIRGADGVERWVVSLPSTQDWQWSSDSGALNDRDSNVALMADNPLLRTAYERAVLEAMNDAGIPPGGDVVLTGFSQGGIMAANLAADPAFPYNTVGVVTNGSPIDSFGIPSHVPVYAFQHVTDIVPALDGNVYDATAPNVTRVVMQGSLSPLAAHNNQAYADSVAAWEKQYAETHGWPPPGLDVFTGEVLDHSIYTTRE